LFRRYKRRRLSAGLGCSITTFIHGRRKLFYSTFSACCTSANGISDSCKSFA
jgi:hypothetical protein